MARFRKIQGQYHAVGVTAILHGCRSCGQPVPVNGLVVKSTCPHCDSSVTVPTRLWQRAMRAVDASALVDADGQHILSANSEYEDTTSDRRLVVQRRILDAPVCIHCGEGLEVSPSSWPQESFEVECGDCGRTTRFGPPEVDMGLPSVQITHVAAPDTEERPEGAIDAAAGDSSAAIVMSCPQCSASLSITAESQRTTTCGYCNASVYLPDDLWRQLHPVRKATRWNAVYRLTPEALREGGLGNVGCTVLLIVLFGGGMFVGLGAGMFAAIAEGHWFPAGIMGLLLAVFGGIALYIVGRSLGSALAYRRLAARLERD